MFAPLAALVGGIVALCSGEPKGYAVAAMIIGGASWSLLLLPLLCL